MIIVKLHDVSGGIQTYSLVREEVLARGMKKEDAEWLAGLANRPINPKFPPPAHTEAEARKTFNLALDKARESYSQAKQKAEQVQRKKDISEQMELQAAINAKLDGFTASRPVTAPYEGVPGCGCVPCTIYWQQKDRARRNPIQYPGGKS
jgi:hypothetical protein